MQIQPPRNPGLPLQDKSLQHRSQWHTMVFIVLAFWLLWSLCIHVLRLAGLPISWWLSLHCITIGVIATAILAYTTHFTQALTRSPQNSYRMVSIRVALLNIGLVILIISDTGNSFAWGSYVGSVLIMTVFLWHLYTMTQLLRHSMAGKFAVTVLYYLAAAALLLLAISAIFVAVHSVNAYTTWVAIHSRFMMWGFVLCTITGTLVTLLPTVTSTTISPLAVARITRALLVHLVGLLLYALALIAGQVIVAGFGLALVALATCLVLYPVLNAAGVLQTRAAGAMMVVAVAWIVLSLLIDAAGQARLIDPRALVLLLVPVVLGAGIVQLILAVLSFLLPVLRGGGPQVIPLARAQAQRFWQLRIALSSLGACAGLVRWVVPTAWASWWPVAIYAPIAIATVIGLATLLLSFRVTAPQ